LQLDVQEPAQKETLKMSLLGLMELWLAFWLLLS
jgi:hypothetical protein